MADGYTPGQNIINGDLSVPSGNVNVTGAGKFFTGSYRTDASGAGQLFNLNNGGLLQMAQATAPSLGAATVGRIQLLAGTTGMKLVVSGATGTFTLLDNII